MKIISNKDYLHLLKNRPGLNPSTKFKGKLLMELQTVKTKKHRFKSFQITVLTGLAAVLILLVFSNDIHKFINSSQNKSEASDEMDVKSGISKDSSIKMYENKKFHVSLQYPKDWKPNNQYYNKYEGEDGYLQIMAYDGENQTIDEVATHEATHKLKPYGSKPVISQLTIKGQGARLITPSDDQPEQYQHQAEIIIKYPRNIEVDGQTFSYFLLIVDKNHIKKIANTIQLN
jgi:hypothetical protein